MLREVKALVAGMAALALLVAPGAAGADFSGDGPADVLTVHPDGRLLMYRGNGSGGWAPNVPDAIGTGWGSFTAFLAPGDFSGDGKPDILVRDGDGRLLMYRGNGAGGWAAGARQTVGSGWGGFTALLAPGDFSGDGNPDILARQPDGTLLLYRGSGASGWLTGRGEAIGSGWNGLSSLTLVPASPPPPAPAPEPAPPAPPATPLPDGNVSLTAGLRCTPPGGLLRVSVKVRRRSGRPAPRVQRIVFYVRNGPRRTDRRRPYTVRLRMHRPAGRRGRVYARVYYRRAGTKTLRHKTVSRRFVMCG